MAESLVFDVANSLLGKLASYVYEEASRAYGVYEHLQGFKDTLSIVSGVLLDAEKKEKSHGLREWVRQIQDICSDAENILEGFELQDKRKKVVKGSRSTKMKVRHFFSGSNTLAFRIKMARQIKDIRERLDKVAADGTKFGLVRVDPGLVIQGRELTYPNVDDLDVIGREGDREKIINLLIKSHPKGVGDKHLCVVPIVGIGGLGKTTLAKLVFNDKRVDQFFHLKMWVCVSNDFDIRQILIKIINSTSTSQLASAPTVTFAHQENITNLDIVHLVSRMKQKLSSQKFLLVLDDIWNDDRAKWIELKDLIKVGARGSKVMVTTRNNAIASMMGNVPSYVLEGLSPKDCLSLFVKWAFKEGEEEKYPNLLKIGKEIVKKCQGVPLAVRTLGSSLFSNFDLSKWESVRDSEIWNLEQKKDEILPALKLSYDQMPSYLRQCFAYFSLFPKDHIFSSYVICSLWVALGLVQSLNGSEKLARKYIDEFHSRGIIHDLDDVGSFCMFKVHDLIHDLAVYVARKDFVAVNSQTLRNIPLQVRHFSIIEKNSFDHYLFPKSKRTRSILFPVFGVGLHSESILDTWLLRHKYLRYLDLSDSSIKIVPNSLSKLEYLRFLDLSGNDKIKSLPNSICNLLNLQVLLLGGCTDLEKLPEGLGNLISLCRMIVTTKQSVLSLDKFASLNHLQTLSFKDCNNLKILFKQQLPSIEELYFDSCGSLECLPLSIFPKLKSLFIHSCRLLNLSLYNEDPIQTLQLKFLFLLDFPRLLKLPEWTVGTANTLETLLVYDFPDLKMLPECLTTMSNLKRVYIRNCPKLLCLPSGMNCLTALEDLRIADCPKLYRKCQPQSGEHWPMISHIKNICIEEPRKKKEKSNDPPWKMMKLEYTM